MTGIDTDRSRLLFVALVAATVVVLVIGTVIGAIAPGASLGHGDATGDTGAHADPETVESGSSLSALERQMADRLAQRARSGSLNLDREQVSQARESLEGSEYEELLDRYGDVANQTGDFEKSLAFRDVRRDQLNLTTAVEAYWTTYDYYRALQDGTVADPSAQRVPLWDGYRAEQRRLARELESQWETIETNHTRLIRSQQTLSTITEANETTSLAAVNRSVREINSTQQRVREQHLTETSLAVRASDRQISFRDPLVIEGRLTRADGTPVASRAVRFAVGNQLLDTRTDDAGEFALSYRPMTLPLNASEVHIEYVPDRNTTLLHSEQTLDVSVEQVEPTVDVSVSPARAEYNESIAVAGRVGENGGGAANVSYLVTVAGRVLGSGETGTDGHFVTNVTLPAGVADGQRTVRVLLPLEGRALASANGSTSLTVVETRTNLTTTVARVDDETIRVRGTLTTVDGHAVAGERVQVSAGGTVLGSTTTDPNGTYEATLVVPGNVVSSGPFDATATLDVAARYDGGATNLGDASAGGSVTLPTTPVGLLLAGGLAVLVSLGAVVVAWRRFGGLERVLGGDGGSTVPEQTLLDDDEYDSDYSATELFDVARGYVDDGREEAAIRLGYVALRLRLAEDIEATAGQTPWEFYQACVEAGVNEDVLDVLGTMTERYERVRFTDERVADGTGASVLVRVGELFDADAVASQPAD